MTTEKAGRKAVILLHEIYGMNNHIRHYENRFSERGYHVFCPDLLASDQPFSYSEELEAYQSFFNHIGFEKASKQISDLIQELAKQYGQIFLIGFSIGATIAWLCSDEENVTGVIGYYGSRIRDLLEVTPACPVLLLFAKQEKSFNVEKVMARLSRPIIETAVFDAAHGFGDPYSTWFNETASEEAFELAVVFLEKHEKNTSMDF